MKKRKRKIWMRERKGKETTHFIFFSFISSSSSFPLLSNSRNDDGRSPIWQTFSFSKNGFQIGKMLVCVWWTARSDQTNTRSRIICLCVAASTRNLEEKRRNKQKLFESTYFDAFLLSFNSLTIFCDVVRYLNTQMTEQSLIVWSEFKCVPRAENEPKIKRTEKMILYCCRREMVGSGSVCIVFVSEPFVSSHCKKRRYLPFWRWRPKWNDEQTNLKCNYLAVAVFDFFFLSSWKQRNYPKRSNEAGESLWLSLKVFRCATWFRTNSWWLIRAAMRLGHVSVSYAIGRYRWTNRWIRYCPRGYPQITRNEIDGFFCALRKTLSISLTRTEQNKRNQSENYIFHFERTPIEVN